MIEYEKLNIPKILLDPYTPKSAYIVRLNHYAPLWRYYLLVWQELFI